MHGKRSMQRNTSTLSRLDRFEDWWYEKVETMIFNLIDRLFDKMDDCVDFFGGIIDGILGEFDHALKWYDLRVNLRARLWRRLDDRWVLKNITAEDSWLVEYLEEGAAFWKALETRRYSSNFKIVFDRLCQIKKNGNAQFTKYRFRMRNVASGQEVPMELI